jgi:hypothetical protein
MMLAGVIPWEGLPAWMYHGQEPPPSHDFNPHVSGITWVDLVFPFFLFSMGAAVPLAHKNRGAGRPEWRTALSTLSRSALLVAFAIFNQHVRPSVLKDEPGSPQFAIGILGFLLALGMFGRFPAQWPRALKVGLKVVGWGGAIALLSVLHYPDHDMPGFAKERSDIIILVLATVSVLGTYAWRATRDSFKVRVALIAVLVAFRISAAVPGSWESAAWNWAPQAWLFSPLFAGYLLIVLPGTIVGELIIRAEGGPTQDRLTAAACFAAVPVALVVFFNHFNPLIAIAYAVLPTWLGYRRLGEKYRPVLLWGFLWLTVGCLFEPFEGGIKKDPYTLSYLFAASGLASYALTGFAALPEKASRALAKVGENPLLAYQGVTVLMPGLWGLAALPLLDRILPPGPAWGLAAAGLETFVLALMVAGFTRLRFTLRV